MDHNEEEKTDPNFEEGRASPNPSPSSPMGKTDFEDFLLFKKMLIPVFIQIIFWIGVASAIFVGLGLMTLSPLSGLIFIVLGTVIWRMLCEMIMVFYRINETLTSIDHKLEKREQET